MTEIQTLQLDTLILLVWPNFVSRARRQEWVMN